MPRVTGRKPHRYPATEAIADGPDSRTLPVVELEREWETGMTVSVEVVHAAWGVSRAESVRDALRLQGCTDRVVALTHDLSVGPIDSFDPAVRRAWFEANLRSDEEPCEEPADSEAPWVEATAVGVHPVHWVCLSDAAEYACFLEFVFRMAGRPFDVVDATGLDVPGAGRVSSIRSLGQLRPAEIVAAGLAERRRPYSRAESDAAVAAWTRLRLENAPLRVLRDGRLVSVPLTHFDAILMGQASGEREPLIKLVARVLNKLDSGLDQPGQGCSYELLFARILALGVAGALEVTGSGPGMRGYEVGGPAARRSNLGTT